MAETYTYTKAECACGTWLPSDPMRTTHEDEAIVVDVITSVAHRCRLCGRKFTVEMIPGDYAMGGHPDKVVSRGHDGHPLLSITQASLCRAESGRTDKRSMTSMRLGNA